MSSVALEVAFGSLVLLGLLTAIQTTLADGATAWGTRVEIMCVILLLLPRPCTAHSRVLCLMPRLIVAITVVLALVLLWIDGDTGVIIRSWSQIVVFIVFLTATGISVVGMLLSTVRSTWWGRLGDIFQTLTTAGTFPSAVTTAGLIDVMRQL